jgi:hypothetical protein
MKMTVLEIEAISRSVAKEFNGDLSIVGVTAADGEADHAELLIALSGCVDEPCEVQVNVPRGERTELEGALRDRFRSAIADQRQQAGGTR